jgi:hypothetical protein
VDGAPGDESALRTQLQGARELLDATGLPWHGICHSHDRFGDPAEAMGRSFAEVIGHPFMAHLAPAPGIDLYLLSGSISLPHAFHPEDHDPQNPPSNGYDIYQPHVWDAFGRFVDANPGSRGRRILFTHQPIVRFSDLIDTGHPDAAHIRHYYFLGQEGCDLCLHHLERLGFQHVVSGHCHLATRNHVRGIEFVTAPSFKNRRTGFARFTWDGGKLAHTIIDWP